MLLAVASDHLAVQAPLQVAEPVILRTSGVRVLGRLRVGFGSAGRRSCGTRVRVITGLRLSDLSSTLLYGYTHKLYVW